MFAGRLTQATLRALDWLAAKTLAPENIPAALCAPAGAAKKMLTSIFGGGATRSSPATSALRNHRGELDLVGWERDVLCFIEVKTRTTRDVKPAEAAVDRDKAKRIIAGGPRLPAADASFVPVAVRRARRIL